jgi:hypothetical protein
MSLAREKAAAASVLNIIKNLESCLPASFQVKTKEHMTGQLKNLLEHTSKINFICKN